jgi:hypothetical protein
MPNHCSQDLFVSGGKADLEAFIEHAKEEDVLLSANKFIPYPEKYKKLDKEAEEARKEWKKDRTKPYPQISDGFNSGGYEWRISNWGTKWGIYDCSVTRTGNSLKYCFNSAWSPASNIILAMSEKFPDLTFKLHYYERGLGYKGKFHCKGGEVLVSEESENYRGNRGG